MHAHLGDDTSRQRQERVAELKLEVAGSGQALGKRDVRRVAVDLRAKRLDVLTFGVEEAPRPPARVVQHEFDHLEGRLFTDRLPDAAGLEVKRDLELLEDIYRGKQSRGELPPEEIIIAELDRLEDKRCKP